MALRKPGFGLPLSRNNEECKEFRTAPAWGWRMLLKLAFALALGSIGVFAVGQLSNEPDERLQLEATIALQLKGLREHLFTR